MWCLCQLPYYDDGSGGGDDDDDEEEVEEEIRQTLKKINKIQEEGREKEKNASENIWRINKEEKKEEGKKKEIVKVECVGKRKEKNC